MNLVVRGWLGKEPTTDSGIDEAEEWTTSEEEDEEEVGEDTEVSGKQKEPKNKVHLGYFNSKKVNLYLRIFT